MTPSRALPRYIFLLLRYSTLSAQPVTLLYDFFQPQSVELTCSTYLRAIIALTYVVVACSELIIMLRLLSIYRTNMSIYRSLWTVYTISMLTAVVTVIIWANRLHYHPFLNSQDINVLPGCWTIEGGYTLYVAFGIVILWEIGISTISIWRTWNIYVTTGTPFWYLFFKSGNQFYACILVITWINLALIGSTVDGKRQIVQERVVLSLTRTAHSVCVAHLLLHIRRQSSRAARAREQEEEEDDDQTYPLSSKNLVDQANLTEMNADGNRSLRSKWEERKKRRKDSYSLEGQEKGEGSREAGYTRHVAGLSTTSNVTLTAPENKLGHQIQEVETTEELQPDPDFDKNHSYTFSQEGLLDTESIRTLRIAENRPHSWRSYRTGSKSPRR